MRCKILFVFVLFSIFVFNQAVLSQSSASTVTKGRIITTDGTTIPFYNLTLGANNHRYQTSGGSAYLEFPVDKTIKIEAQRGTRALETSAYMGVVMLGTMLVATQLAKNKYPDDKGRSTPIVIGATGGAFLLGAIIGLTKKKYVEVYSNSKYNTGFKFSRLQLQLAFNKKTTSFGFQYCL